MAGISNLQNRMKSVRDTRKITNAMYLIASAKMNRARQDLELSRPHFLASQAIIADLLAHLPDIAHPYIGDTLTAARPGKTAYLVVSGDKGLAGAYNMNVLKQLSALDLNPERAVLYTIGEVGYHSALNRGDPVDESMHFPSQDPNITRARELSAQLCARYLSGELSEIYVLYTTLDKLNTAPVCRRLLPLYHSDFTAFALPDDGKPPVYLPGPQEILDTVVPNYITGFLFGMMVESFCAELDARMVAMKSATDNADEMLEQLTLDCNRARQEAITQEITEISSGARAQKKGESLL